MTADERDWAVIRAAAARWAGQHAEPAALDRVLAGALDQVQAPRPARLRWAWLLARAQLPVVRQRLVAASLLVMLIGAGIALAAGRGWAQQVFVLLAPLAAAGSTSVVFRDGLGELALPAAPRVVLMARLVLVFAVDLAVTLTVSLAVAGRTSVALGTLIGAWLGPMLLLAAASLLVSTLSSPGAGLAVALGLWLLRVLVGLDPAGGIFTRQGAAWVHGAWMTSPAILAAAAVLAAVAVLAAPRRLLASAP